MRIKFGSWGKEAEDINSGKVKSITREIDMYDPIFEELEKIQASYTSKDPIYGCSSLGLLYIEGECDVQAKIKKISYKDGSVIIEW